MIRQTPPCRRRCRTSRNNLEKWRQPTNQPTNQTNKQTNKQTCQCLVKPVVGRGIEISNGNIDSSAWSGGLGNFVGQFHDEEMP